MLDHISLRVRDYDKALAFYRAALAPIGYDVIMEYPGSAGLGVKGKPDLWLTKTEGPINPTHIAFSGTREQVSAFHAAALMAAGQDNGAPGLRLDYHPDYYAAFILDSEGNNIEVVCHQPPGMVAKIAARTTSAKRPKKAHAKKPAMAKAKKGKAKRR
jgi:catechol 2,3-dioxygenase-like lactoylglutathione lyase family enzyme